MNKNAQPIIRDFSKEKTAVSNVVMIILVGIAIVAGLLWFLNKKPLTKFIDFTAISPETEISVTMLEDGNNFSAFVSTTQDEEMKAFIKVLDTVSARRKTVNEFPNDIVYGPIFDTIDVIFNDNGTSVQYYISTEKSILYEIRMDKNGIVTNYYTVPSDTFEKLAQVVRQYNEKYN